MFIGYCRVSTKGQLDGNSIEEQTLSIRERYPTAEIVVESYICYAIPGYVDLPREEKNKIYD